MDYGLRDSYELPELGFLSRYPNGKVQFHAHTFDPLDEVELQDEPQKKTRYWVHVEGDQTRRITRTQKMGTQSWTILYRVKGKAIGYSYYYRFQDYREEEHISLDDQGRRKQRHLYRNGKLVFADHTTYNPLPRPPPHKAWGSRIIEKVTA